MLKKILIYLWAIALIVFLFWTYFHNKSNDQWLIENGKVTVGTVFSTGKSLSIVYNVGENTITRTDSKPYSGIIDGEQFLISYDPKDSANIAVRYFDPVITDSSEIYFRKTNSITNKRIWFNKKNIVFTYIVNDKEYERIQWIKPNQKIDNNKNYLVKYRKDDPEIAYIFLDSMVVK